MGRGGMHAAKSPRDPGEQEDGPREHAHQDPVPTHDGRGVRPGTRTVGNFVRQVSPIFSFELRLQLHRH